MSMKDKFEKLVDDENKKVDRFSAVLRAHIDGHTRGFKSLRKLIEELGTAIGDEHLEIDLYANYAVFNVGQRVDGNRMQREVRCEVKPGGHFPSRAVYEASQPELHQTDEPNGFVVRVDEYREYGTSEDRKFDDEEAVIEFLMQYLAKEIARLRDTPASSQNNE